jgi:hypothetical protein
MPLAGAVLSNTVPVSATATDNVAVVGVQFQVDGNNLGTEVTATPYTNSWNTLTVANGSHTVRAIARDAAGNRATNGVSITVSNSSTLPPPPPEFVQQNYATPQSSQSQVAVSYPGPQAAGNLNILAIGWNDEASSVSAVSDSAGNSYQVAVPTFRGNGLSQVIYYAPNINAGNNTVTVTFDQSADFPDVRATEYSGLALSNPFVAGNSASGNSAVANSGAAITGHTNELVFGAGMTDSTFTSPGSGFTQVVITSPDADIVEHKVAATPGTYSASASLTAGNWLMQVATFQTPASFVVTAPQITGFGFSGGDFRVSFETAIGQTYDLQSSTDMTSGSWQSIATNIQGTGATVQVSDTNAVSNVQRFYRVRTGM